MDYTRLGLSDSIIANSMAASSIVPLKTYNEKKEVLTAKERRKDIISIDPNVDRGPGGRVDMARLGEKISDLYNAGNKPLGESMHHVEFDPRQARGLFNKAQIGRRRRSHITSDARNGPGERRTINQGNSRIRTPYLESLTSRHGDEYDPKEAEGLRHFVWTVAKKRSIAKHHRGADKEVGEFSPPKQGDSYQKTPYIEGFEIVAMDEDAGTVDLLVTDEYGDVTMIEDVDMEDLQEIGDTPRGQRRLDLYHDASERDSKRIGSIRDHIWKAARGGDIDSKAWKKLDDPLARQAKKRSQGSWRALKRMR